MGNAIIIRRSLACSLQRSYKYLRTNLSSAMNERLIKYYCNLVENSWLLLGKDTNFSFSSLILVSFPLFFISRQKLGTFLPLSTSYVPCVSSAEFTPACNGIPALLLFIFCQKLYILLLISASYDTLG